MEPVTRDDIVDIAQYERIRADFRTRVLAAKERRRVSVGPTFTFLFENHLTVLYQVQEMMRVERIVEEQAIAHEMRTYNELIPPAGGIGATLLIEYTDPAERAVALGELVGIEKHVHIALDGLPPVPGRFDERQMNDRKVSSVQYVTFTLPAGHRDAWGRLGAAGGIRLAVDHPRYAHHAALSADAAAALGEDLGL